MRKLLESLFLFFIFLVFPSSASAQVVINEVSPVSDPEWVEIYNVGVSGVLLKDYKINFGSETQNKIFCDNEVIGPNEYKIVLLSSSWLSNTGDLITLKRGDDVVDSIGYGSGYALVKPTASGSISRSPDGGTNWVVIDPSTKQGNTISFNCPTPTPTVEPTTAPTPTPTPNPTPTPTKSPTPIPTKSPTPKPTNTPSSSPEVLGEGTTSAPKDLEPSATPLVLDSTKKKFPLIPVVFIGSGLVMIGFAAVQLVNAKKSAQET